MKLSLKMKQKRRSASKTINHKVKQLTIETIDFLSDNYKEHKIRINSTSHPMKEVDEYERQRNV